MNNFIVSGKGFLKSITFNIETKEFDIEWTQQLRDDKRFNSKSATKLIDKHQIDCFVFNPYKEEPIRGKWKIIKRRDIYCENHNVFEYIPERVVMESKTDVKFLNGVDNKTYYDSYDDFSRVLKDNEFPDESICDKCTGCGNFMDNGEEKECFQNREQGDCFHRFCDYEQVGMDLEDHLDDICDLLSVDEIINQEKSFICFIFNKKQ